MRYRRLTPDWDFQLGHGPADYLADSPEAVLQAVLTRLKLFTGEWFNDTEEGTPWRAEVLGRPGEYARAKHDAAIRRRISQTLGVTKITEYHSGFDGDGRRLRIEATIDTVYGQVQVLEVL